MKRSRFRIERARRGVASSLLLVAVAATAEPAPWQIEARTLHPPAAASAEMQAYLRLRGTPTASGPLASTPDSIDAWLASQSARDAERAESAREIAARLSVSVETSEIAGIRVYLVTPPELNPALSGRLFLHYHGGAYVYGGGDASYGEAVVIAARAGIGVVSVDYRRPPLHPYPAAVDDAVAVYAALLEHQDATSIAVGGTSAGGGLSLAMVQAALAAGHPAPGALWLGTPWADLTDVSDSLHTLRGIDAVLVQYEGGLAATAALYAGDRDLDHPGVSPVYGAFAGFPPTQIVTGTRDLFLSDAARTHQAIRAEGGQADLIVLEGVSHAEYAFLLDAEESLATYRQMRSFLETELR